MDLENMNKLNLEKYTSQELEWIHEAIIKEIAISYDLDDSNGYLGILNKRLDEVRKEINYKNNKIRYKIKKDCNFN
jgi:hypothetical protein